MFTHDNEEEKPQRPARDVQYEAVGYQFVQCKEGVDCTVQCEEGDDQCENRLSNVMKGFEGAD